MATLGSPYDRQGAWTPTLTFATPGDLSVTYAARLGFYIKAGRQITAWFQVTASAFTHTTASGNCLITGLPFIAFDPNAGGLNWRGDGLTWQGITKANYTQIVPVVDATTTRIRFSASGSGQANANIAPADMPTGGSVVFAGAVSYIVANT